MEPKSSAGPSPGTTVLIPERSKRASLMGHVQSELHDPESQRLDAQRIARTLNLPLSRLSRALRVSPALLQKSPDARSLQPGLANIAFCYGALKEVLGTREQALLWLSAPHPDLEAHTPLSLIEEGKSGAVVDLLKNALAGQMS